MALLRVIRGPNAGQEYVLESADVIVGRRPGCAILLDHRAVSRTHARIVPEGKEFVIEDLRSRNGTKINGQRRERHRLQPHDRITICGYEFEFSEAPSQNMAADDTEV